MELINLKDIENLLRAVLYSGYLANEKPISLILIADVESGKTELVKKYRFNKGIAYLTDATAWGITSQYKSQLENNELKHIIIPDLLTPFSKKDSSVKSFITFMNGLMEEGIFKIKTYATNIDKEINSVGLIGCLTKQEFNKKFRNMKDVGFLSRCLPVTFSYSKETVIKIFESIIQEDYINESEKNFNFPKEPVKIKLPVEIAREIANMTLIIAKETSIYGFRLQKSLQRLIKANALINNRKRVTQGDFEDIKKYINFINLDYNSI